VTAQPEVPSLIWCRPPGRGTSRYGFLQQALNCVLVALLGLAAIGATSRATASAQAETEENTALPPPVQVQDGNRMLVRADHRYQPYSYLDERGEPAGFLVDLMAALAEVMGLEVDIQLGPWEEVRRDLESGRIDVVLGMYYSPERDGYVDFSVPVTIATHAIFVRDDSPISSLRDLRGQEILVQTDDIMHDFLLNRGLTQKIFTYDEQIQVLRQLAAGKHDAALLAKLPGLYWAERYKLTNLKTVGGPLEARKYCLAVTEGDEVTLAILNEGIGILQATGRIQAIRDTWFGVYDQPSGMKELLLKAAWVLVPLALLLVISFAWNWSLQRTVAHQTRELNRELVERRRAEQALRDSEEMARAVLNASSESIFLVDRDGMVLDINAAAAERLGIVDSIVGKNLLDYFPPDLAAARKVKVERVLESKQPVRFEDERDGRVFQVTACPVFEIGGGVNRVAVYAKDITEQRRAEQERSRLEAQVMHAQKLESLGVLAGGIAHDFNNLLMGILGNAELALADLAGSAPARESLNEIQTAANRAADLCRQMLAYSGKGRFDIQSLDLSDLVAEMTQLLAVSVSKNAVVAYECDPDLPAVEGDAAQLRQIVLNLVTNAADALDNGTGTIRVRTGVTSCDRAYLRTTYLGEELPAGDYVFLEVTDDGCGMEEPTLQRIFEPFFTTKFPGRGLGLAAVLGIVRAHQGTLTVASEPGRGTTFRVLLPVSEHADEVYLAGRRPSVAAGDKVTVLVVDDEDAVRALTARMLEKLGYKVMTAGGGQQGLELFRNHRQGIAAVLLDMTMPRMSGEEIYQELRKLQPDIKVLFTSGHLEPSILADKGDSKHIGFVQKPYQMTMLGQKLREILSRS